MNYYAYGILGLWMFSVAMNFYHAGKGTVKKPYGITDIITALIGFSLMLPLVGRVLNWW
jgi:hypothetical protein